MIDTIMSGTQRIWMILVVCMMDGWFGELVWSVG